MTSGNRIAAALNRRLSKSRRSAASLIVVVCPIIWGTPQAREKSDRLRAVMCALARYPACGASVCQTIMVPTPRLRSGSPASRLVATLRDRRFLSQLVRQDRQQPRVPRIVSGEHGVVACLAEFLIAPFPVERHGHCAVNGGA